MSDPTLHGWVVLDKPQGMTSNYANMRIRKILGCKGTGFAGTLDPLATGVLPIAVGEATKVLPYVMNRNKTYAFSVQWGEQRDTGDQEGQVLTTSDYTPSAEEITHALPQFHGAILQTPPVYSAIKVHGTRSCDRVRRGEHVTLKARPVHVISWTLISHDHAQRISTFQVTCGSGTYVRSLAIDLASVLGTCGYVTFLRRLCVGPFTEDLAFSLVSLTELAHSGVGRFLLPLAVVLDDIPDIAVTEAQALMLRQGQPCCVDSDLFVEHTRVWVHLPDTRHVIAMGDVRGGKIWPVRVFSQFS